MKPVTHNGDDLLAVRESPIRIVSTIALFVFICELVVMLLLSFPHPFSHFTKALFDSTLLTIFLSPVLYYFLFRPFTSLRLKQIRAMKELRESKREKALILNAFQEVVIFHDRDLKNIWVNKSAADSVEKRPDELTGLYCHSIWFDREEPCDGCPVMKAIATGQYESGEVTLPDGRVSFTQGHPVIGPNGDVEGVIEISSDITEKKKAEKALEESEHRFQAIIENMAKVVYLKDLEGKYLLLNRHYEFMVNLSREQVIGKTDYDIFPPEIAARFNESDIKAIQTKSTVELEEVVSLEDGDHVFVTVKFPLLNTLGEPYALCGIATEITEIKQAQEALRESEEKYRILFEATGTATFVIEEDMTFSLVNDDFKTRFGYSTGELIGRKWTEIVPKEDLERLEEYHRLRRVDPDAVPTNYHLRLIDSQGSLRDILISIELIPGTKKSIGALTDISELKQAQQALRELNEQLEARVEERTKELKEAQERLIDTERLAVLGHFSGSISHELRNPLGVIDSSAYYMMEKLKDTEGIEPKVIQHLERIKDQVRYSTAIIESLLNLTRMEEPRKERFDLVKSIKDILTSSERLRGVKVVRDIPDENVFVQGDSEQLRMVFENIIKNAMDAMDAMEGRGQISIGMARKEEKTVEVSFEDTGSGIEPENMSRVFQPLFSTKVKGIGFGLSISKQIVEKHKGEIEVKSELGKGARFVVRLPVS